MMQLAAAKSLSLVFCSGEGKIVINGRELSEYFSLKTLELVVRQPLETTETLGKYDVTANVVGGGIAGQAGAVRHGIARALLKVDGDYRPSEKSWSPDP